MSALDVRNVCRNSLEALVLDRGAEHIHNIVIRVQHRHGNGHGTIKALCIPTLRYHFIYASSVAHLEPYPLHYTQPGHEERISRQ